MQIPKSAKSVAVQVRGGARGVIKLAQPQHLDSSSLLGIPLKLLDWYKCAPKGDGDYILHVWPEPTSSWYFSGKNRIIYHSGISQFNPCDTLIRCLRLQINTNYAFHFEPKEPAHAEHT